MQAQMLQRCRGAARLLTNRSAGGAHSFAASSATAAQPQATYDVPAGHASSDLSDVACNLSLSRRRDLTLRQDLYLTQDGKTVSVADLLRVSLLLLLPLTTHQWCPESLCLVEVETDDVAVVPYHDRRISLCACVCTVCRASSWQCSGCQTWVKCARPHIFPTFSRT